MFQKQTAILLLTLMALFGLTLTATAAQQVMTLIGGDNAEIDCDGRRLVLERISKTKVIAKCRPHNATPTDPPESQPSDTPEPEPTPETALISEYFDTYDPGTDPDGWLDTDANNSMVENNSLFKVENFGDERVFGTSSTLTNIHSHFLNTDIGTLSGYEYSGRMLMTANDSGLGVTFFSQYPQRDAYYRLRRYNNLSFRIDPHGTTMSGGQSDTGVVPVPNDWYQFKIRIQDTGSRTEIKAKIWPQTDFEPDNWQINAYDDSSDRLTTGTIGVWSYNAGSKYWDNLVVEPLSSTPAPEPTDPPEPEPSDTPEPEPTDPPPSNDELCPDHDPTKWHPLFDADRNCHYDHEHKDDPFEVDDIFGPVGSLYNNQEVSYPWQTSSDAGTENELKHGGYGWLVRRDMGCSSRFSDGCVTDFRLQYHAIMASVGAVTRYHSFWLEGRGCREDNPDLCGIIRTGGWMDFGILRVDGDHIPLPNDPGSEEDGGQRLHAFETGNRSVAAWYGGEHGFGNFALLTYDAWGVVDPNDPNQLHLFCPDFNCRHNGSTMEAHITGFYIPERLDDDGDGLVTYAGYTNRFGQIVENCTEPGLDCVPLEIIDMPLGRYQYRDDTHGFDLREYDTSPEGQWWIDYPN